MFASMAYPKSLAFDHAGRQLDHKTYREVDRDMLGCTTSSLKGPTDL